jgi:hypothetical protein
MAITRLGPNQDITAAKIAGQINFKNLIINGDMSIAQRGTSASGLTGAGYNTMDRMRIGGSSYGTFTQSQSTDVPAGQGFGYSLKMDCTTANASLSAGSILILQQRFEGQMLQQLKKGTANAESLTLSFWVKSNKTGTYICDFYDSDNTRTISKSYTINASNTWEKKTLTFAGDTTGTLNNDNNRSLDLNFFLVAGTTYTSGTLQTSWGTNVDANRAVGQVNLADDTANEWFLTGVQLEADTSASDFEFLPYDVNLLRCQRYYYRMSRTGGDYPFASGYQYGSTGVTAFFPFPVFLRASGSVSLPNGSLSSKTDSGGATSITSMGLLSWSNNFLTLNGSTSTTHTGNHTCVITNSGSGDSGIAIDCEL